MMYWISNYMGRFRWVVCQIHILQRLKGDKNTIMKALACLPRDLDETYERIFLQIPDETRLVVYHALKWIYAHNALRADNIPSSNLIQVVQRSTSGLNSNGYDFDYNMDLLRELCGCLISLSPQKREEPFQPTTAVAFAHYTVPEFLGSERIRTGPASFFAIDKESVKLEFAKMVMLEVVDSKPLDLFWNIEDAYDLGEEIADAMDESFKLYSVVSSILAVRKWGPALSRDTASCNLASALLDVSRQQFPRFHYTAACMEIATEVFSEYCLYRSEQFWALDWGEQPTDEAVRTLTNMLFTDESTELGRKFLQSVHAGNWLQSRVHLGLKVWHLASGVDADWYNFEGTIVELFALLSHKWPKALRLFLELAIGYFDPTKVLLHSIGRNFHLKSFGCEGYCTVARLVQLGADPDGPGSRICPLQIAAWAWDLDGVRALLEAGANPNCTGDRMGEVWKEGTMLALFNGAKDHSPLNIVETMGCFFQDGRFYKSKGAAPKVAALLREYGGESFVRTEAEP